MLIQFTASIWGDEGFSAILSMKSIPEILSIIARDTSPPLYNLTEHLVFNVFGNGEIVIRGLSFFYYLIAIFFVYKIAAYYWNRRTGVLAAALAFLNPFFFIYAFEGRMYSILAAAVTSSMYFFITEQYLGYIFATTAALYSHHFSIFAIFIQGLWFLKKLVNKRERHEAFNIFKSFVVIGFLYLPWIIPLYNQTKMVAGGFWLGKPTLGDLRQLIYKYLAQGISHPYSQYTLYVTFAILILRKWQKKVQSTFFLLLWFLGPILLTWLVSQKFQSIFYDRYLLYTIPAVAIVMVSNYRKISLILIALLLGMFATIDWQYFTHPTKLPFKELAAYVLEQKRGDDYLINWNSSAHHLWETKYYGIPAPIYIPGDGQLPYFVGTALMTPADISRSIPKGTYRIGVITSGSVDEVQIPLYTKSEVKEFGSLKIIWLQTAKVPIPKKK
jgi:uncharacterized membrane protein